MSKSLVVLRELVNLLHSRQEVFQLNQLVVVRRECLRGFQINPQPLCLAYHRFLHCGFDVLLIYQMLFQLFFEDSRCVWLAKIAYFYGCFNVKPSA